MRRGFPWMLAFALSVGAGEITIDLKNPAYRNGILYTDEGGVIQNDDIRIQARHIQYIHHTENKEVVQKIEAEGDLLIQYKGRAYAGDALEYDFMQSKGRVFGGKTFASLWYVGGDEIELMPDGSYNVKNATITTCENKDSSWDFHAGKVDVTKNELLSAKKVRFRFFKIPFMWFPSFKLNMKKFKEPVLRYSINWDKGQGPRAMARYQLFSWQEFALFARLE
ncbi:MAG: hypothetical protein RL235_892, partial [Chlamydiota bacterium]